MKRRTFLKSTVAAGSGLTILPSGIVGAVAPPSSKLNIAVIGVGGRGGANLNGVQGENIAALCDVDENALAKAAQRFPKARTYADWRECVEQKDLDAVVCSTTDHTHAFVNVWALNRGLHVYCEKPLANSVHEARTVREAYLKTHGKAATQMGTQMHANDNFRRAVELVRHGAIGVPQEARAWCNRRPKGGSYLPEVKPVPAHLNWDLWIGPSPFHPYNPGYPGSCLKWNRFWDFGSGQIGDMGSHVMDMAFWALDLRFPTFCEAEGSPVTSDTCPQWLKAEWHHPANAWRPAVKVYWYDGDKKPGMPSATLNPDKLGKGVFVKGDKGTLYIDYHTLVLLPRGDMTHYKSPTPDDLIPRSKGHYREWIHACKTGEPTTCNFDYSGALIEQNLLGLVAYRAGSKLTWDAKALKAVNCPEADRYIRKTYRQGWTLNG